MSQRESFCFNFFHTKIRGPKFCHKGEAFIFNFSTQTLGDLLGDLNFVTTTRLSLLNFGHHETRNSCAPPSLLSPPLTQFQKQQKKGTPPLYVCQRESGSQIHTHDLFCMSLLTTKVESRASPVKKMALFLKYKRGPNNVL